VIRTPILRGGKYGKMLGDIPMEKMEPLFERFRPMSPVVFSRKVLDAVAKNKAIIVFPTWWKVFWWLNRLSPSLWIFLAHKSFLKSQKDLREMQRH